MTSLPLSIDERVEQTLEEMRPAIRQHFGDVEFVKFSAGTVYVRMLGMCSHCPLSQITLKQGIEEMIKARIAEVREVQAV